MQCCPRNILYFQSHLVLQSFTWFLQVMIPFDTLTVKLRVSVAISPLNWMLPFSRRIYRRAEYVINMGIECHVNWNGRVDVSGVKVFKIWFGYVQSFFGLYFTEPIEKKYILLFSLIAFMAVCTLLALKQMFTTPIHMTTLIGTHDLYSWKKVYCG